MLVSYIYSSLDCYVSAVHEPAIDCFDRLWSDNKICDGMKKKGNIMQVLPLSNLGSLFYGYADSL